MIGVDYEHKTWINLFGDSFSRVLVSSKYSTFFPNAVSTRFVIICILLLI